MTAKTVFTNWLHIFERAKVGGINKGFKVF